MQFTLVCDEDVSAKTYIDGSVVHDLTIKTSSADMIHAPHLLSGITALNPVISSGGTRHVNSGASAIKPTMYTTGCVCVYSGGTISDAVLSTGSAANLGLNDTLDSAYGIYEGWGFALEDSTLKFKQLA